MEGGRRRVGAVDLFRFLFAIVIVVYHAGGFYYTDQSRPCGSGYIAVEFFFMVSGWLLARKAESWDGGDVWLADLKMLRDKFVRIFPCLLLACVFSNIVYALCSPAPLDIWHRGLFTATDFFALQMEGFPGFFATGVSWYLSALFLVSFLIYPLLCRRREAFVKFIAPLSAVFIYGFINHELGGLNFPDHWWGVVYQGLLRGWAGMALGCCAYGLKPAIDADPHGALWGFFELAGYGVALVYALCHPQTDIHDFLIIPFLFLAVAVSFSEKSLLNRFLGRGAAGRACSLLGALSLSVYLNHYYLAQHMKRLFPGNGRNRLLLIYLIGVAALALANDLLGRRALSRWLNSVRRIVLVSLALLLAAQGIYFAADHRMNRLIAGFGGSGTAEDPWRVDGAEDLRAFRDLVNGGEDFAEGHFLQTADIDLGDEPFTPIGLFGTDHVFRGDYNGGGHTLSGLRVESVYRLDLGNAGLFGMLQGTVRNLGVESGLIRGDYCGGIASQAAAGARVVNCYSRAVIEARYRGGSVGDNFNGATMTLCAGETPVIGYGCDCITGCWPGELPDSFAGECVTFEAAGDSLPQRLDDLCVQLTEAGLLCGDEIIPWGAGEVNP